MSYDITPIIQAVLALCAALVTALVIPWVKAKLGAQGTETLLAWVNIAVAAAEQLYADADGGKKKAYVLEFLAGKGYQVDEKALDNAIEAAVLKLHKELYGARQVSA